MKRKKIQIAKWGTPKKNNLRKAHQKKHFLKATLNGKLKID